VPHTSVVASNSGGICDPIYRKAIAPSIKMDHHQPTPVCLDCQCTALEEGGTSFLLVVTYSHDTTQLPPRSHVQSSTHKFLLFKPLN